MIRSMETSKGTVTLRDAGLADADAYRELRLFALQESPTAFGQDYGLNARHPMSFWKDRLKPDEYGIIFVAEHNNQLIGMTGIRRGESSKSRHSAGIWGVYVHPEWRGLRIAEGLLDICCEWAKLREVKIVKLRVMSKNESAVRLYERCGFSIYGTEPLALYHEEQYHESLHMFRLLANPKM